MYIAIFDICDTLYKANTTISFIDYLLLRENKSNFLKNKILKIVLVILGKIINQDIYRYLYVKNLKGYSRAYLSNVANEYVNYLTAEKKNDEVHIILNKLIVGNKKIVLCSASLDFVVEAIAKKLKIVEFYSTKLSYTNDICDGYIINDLLGNKDKLFDNNIIDLVVTDNKSDLNLIKKARKYIVVSRKKDLDFWAKEKINVEIINE